MLCYEICYSVYVYEYFLCSNGIPHLLSVSPNTHPLLLHPDKDEEQVEEEEQEQFCGWKWPPSAPRTRAAAVLRMKQIALDNQSRTIRRLRAQLAIERRGLATTKKELEDTQIALEASHKVIAGLTKIGLSMFKKIERMKAKNQKARESHVVCHQKFQAHIQEAED
uniref:Adenosine deaminase-like protein n=1 Tax=Dorcoceras hygrometricum TaxID=472368 RepID=A0A2Z7AT44_9LAMI|nr:adenosine deaminase-like protein [Dorcoceras hygrometricum]